MFGDFADFNRSDFIRKLSSEVNVGFYFTLLLHTRPRLVFGVNLDRIVAGSSLLRRLFPRSWCLGSGRSYTFRVLSGQSTDDNSKQDT